MYVGTPCATSGISNLTASPARPLTNYISQIQPFVSIKVQPERSSLSFAKPTTADGSFVSKWYGFITTCMCICTIIWEFSLIIYFCVVVNSHN